LACRGQIIDRAGRRAERLLTFVAGPLMAKDRDALLRNLIAGYGDSIRLSDIKANIAVLFVAIMMGTVLSFRDHYPRYLSAPVLLAPFIFIFFNLLASVYPRYPRAGRKRFPVLRNSRPEDFEFIGDPAPEAEELPARCALLSRILYWKTVTLQVAYLAAMATIVAAAALLFVAWR
jgi:hypothetical protein